ncbi:MAG: formate/nitrite transporter family protein, partial [Bacteroidota bacterium]
MGPDHGQPVSTFSTEHLHDALDHSQSGAPAAGEAVRDLFSTDEIFQRVVATANEEFSRSSRLLFLSGIAAGLSIGLSLVARAIVLTFTGTEGASELVGNLVYPVGFVLIVLGRYQLYTENTLTPVTLVLTRLASVPKLLKVWGVVLTANVLGAALMALVLIQTGIFDEAAAAMARSFGEHALETSWRDLFWKGVFAGWIVASMVWLTHATRNATARLLLVFFLMYLIPTLDLFHCIIGAG